MSRHKPKGYSHYRNSDYFADINDLQVCADAGFIWADGSVSKGGVLSFGLAKKDLSFLKRLKERLQYSGAIALYKKNSSVRFQITDRKIVSDLRFFGVIPRKTYLPIIPNLSGDKKLAFIAGLHIGDGWLSHSRYRNWGICSYKPEILAWVRESLCDLAPLNIHYGSGCYRISASGTRARKINDLLTALPIEYMKRKTFNG